MKEIEQVADCTALGDHELAEGRNLGLATGEPHTLREASAKTTHPLRLGPLWDDAQAGLRSRAGRLLGVLRCTNGDEPKLHELFSSAATVCAIDPFAAVDSEKQGAEQEKVEAIVDEFDRLRRAQLESAEISRAFGDAMGTIKSAVEFANNRLHDMTAMLTSALLLAITGLGPAIEGIGRAVTDVVGERAGILRVDCGAEAKTREHGANAGMLHAAQTELTQAESHE
jgi:hypothetical protein